MNTCYGLFAAHIKQTPLIKLGSGEFGTVYKVIDDQEHISSLKIPLAPCILTSKYNKALRHILQEEKALKILSGIEPIVERENLYVLKEGKKRLIALQRQYIDGRELKSIEDITDTKHQILLENAVKEAHKRGVASLDLGNPANIIIDNYGKPHIIDIGTARFREHTRPDEYMLYVNNDFRCLEMIFDSSRRKV